MLKTNYNFYWLFRLHRPWVVSVFVLLTFFVGLFGLVSKTLAQNGDIFNQLSTLQVGQPFPPGLENQAESVDKRGQKQIYYFRSTNYVYPHFVETDGGHIIHIAVFVDPSRAAEYTQKLGQSGKPEVVLQNTENELVLGFPSKGVVFVVNAQKQPVVYERLKPISEKAAIQTYSSDAVIAAVEEDAEAQAHQQILLKYPSAIIKFAVNFYTAILENPQIAMIVVALLIAVAVLFQVIRSVQTSLKKQREAEIASLMQETLAINKQREIAATVAQTVSVPHQSAKTEASVLGTTAQPVFDVTAIEPAEFRPSDHAHAYTASSVESKSSQLNQHSGEVISDGAQAVSNPYQAPDPELWRQKAQYNPSLAADLQRVIGDQAVPAKTDVSIESERPVSDTQPSIEPENTLPDQLIPSDIQVANTSVTSDNQPIDQLSSTDQLNKPSNGS